MRHRSLCNVVYLNCLISSLNVKRLKVSMQKYELSPIMGVMSQMMRAQHLNLSN